MKLGLVAALVSTTVTVRAFSQVDAPAPTPPAPTRVEPTATTPTAAPSVVPPPPPVAPAPPAVAPVPAAAPSVAPVGSAPPSPDAAKAFVARDEVGKLIEEAIAEHEKKKEREAVAKRKYRHDGGYVRLGWDIGYAIDRAERDDQLMKSRGVGLFLQLKAGVNVSDTFVLGGGFHSIGVLRPTTKVDDRDHEGAHTAFYQVTGAFIEYFPDPTRGLHLSAMLGSGSADVVVNDEEHRESGFGLALGAGYDFWLAEQWSAGPAAQLLVIAGAEDDFGDHRVYLPTLSLTALWH